MRLVVNKKTKRELFKELTDIIYPTSEYWLDDTVSVYTDLSIDNSFENVPYQLFLWVPETFIETLETINTTIRENTINIEVDLGLFFNTLYFGNDTSRESALNRLVEKYIITEQKRDTIMGLFSHFTNFNSDFFYREFDDSLDRYKYYYSGTMGLKNDYKIENNLTIDKMYVIIPVLTPVSFSECGSLPGTNGLYNSIVSLYSPKLGRLVNHCSYMGLEVTEIDDEFVYSETTTYTQVNPFEWYMTIPDTVV